MRWACRTVVLISQSVIILDVSPFMHSRAQNLAFGTNGTTTTENDPKPLTAANQKTKVTKMPISKATGKYVLIAHVDT